ncbi:MAG TPA: ATP synthase F1 subunit epsilon [Myxococcota bacterium]|nr:ATP synthase F1 subunit epsilon [Myxococcota bacterium]
MSLTLSIVTPHGTVFEGPVESVVVPGSEGDFGVLPGHERFLSPVRIGELEVRGPNGRWAAVSDGFADVGPDRVVLMVDSCEFAADIDTARAERARARAEREVEQLRQSQEEEQRFQLAQAALERAIVRLLVAKRR